MTEPRILQPQLKMPTEASRETLAPLPPAPLWHGIVAWSVVAVIVALFVGLQVYAFTPGYSEVDPDGYLLLAKGFARGPVSRYFADDSPLPILDNDPMLYQIHVWVQNDRGEILPKFAPGFPALMGLSYRIFARDEAMFYVSPFMGAMTLIGAFCLFRQWLPRGPSVVGTFLIAANSTFLFYSGYMLTHATEICFVTWGMFLLWKWLNTVAPRRVTEALHAMDDAARAPLARREAVGVVPPNESLPYAEPHEYPAVRPRVPRWPSILWGVLAGLVLGYACTVRHTAALLAIAVAGALIWGLVESIRLRIFSIWRFVPLVLSYSVFPLLLAWYNLRFFGSFRRTGYDLTREQLDFDVRGFLQHFPLYSHGLAWSLAPLTFGLGLIGILFFGPVRDRVMKVLWALPIYLIYAGYYYAQENNVSWRFILPLMPVFVGSAFLPLLALRVSSAKRWGIMVMLALVVLFNSEPFLFEALGIDPARYLPPPPELTAAQIKARADADPPTPSIYPNALGVVDVAKVTDDPAIHDDAVIFAEGGMRVYIGTRRQFKLYSISSFEPNPRAAYEYDPYRQLAGWEPRGQLSRRAQIYYTYKNADAKELHQARADRIDIALMQGRQVVFLMGRRDPKNVEGMLEGKYDVKEIVHKETKHAGTWGVYEVTAKPPLATQPVPAP